MPKIDGYQRRADPDPYFGPQHRARPGGGDREGHATFEPVAKGTGNQEQQGNRSCCERAPQRTQGAAVGTPALILS